MVVTPLNLTAVPECGLFCFASAASLTTCAPTNTTCICLDTSLAESVSSCILGNCTIKEQLLTQRATSISCDVQYYDYDSKMIAINAVLFALQSVFFLLRMLSRAVRLAPWGLDDTTMVIAWLLSTGFLIGNIYEAAALHIGRPYWARTFEEIDQGLLIYYICEIFYSITLGLIKISICFLYMRVFERTVFQRVMWATQVFNVCLIVAFLAADFAECTPISSYWTAWDGVRVGRCFDLYAFGYAHAGINIVLDVWMLVLPATQVTRLNMSLRRKLEVMSMFSFGILLTAISIARLVTLQQLSKDPLNIQTYYAVAVWSNAEIHTGIFVACLPAARIVFIKYAGTVLTATGVSRSKSEHGSGLPQHDKSSGNCSAERSGGGGGGMFSTKLKLPSSLGMARLSSSNGSVLVNKSRASTRSKYHNTRGSTVSEEELTGRGSYVELDNIVSKE